MELLSVIFTFVGGFTVWYLNKSSKDALQKKATKAVMYFDRFEKIDYEVETLQRKWMDEGFISTEDQAYIAALYGRRFNLIRNIQKA